MCNSGVNLSFSLCFGLFTSHRSCDPSSWWLCMYCAVWPPVRPIRHAAETSRMDSIQHAHAHNIWSRLRQHQEVLPGEATETAALRPSTQQGCVQILQCVLHYGCLSEYSGLVNYWRRVLLPLSSCSVFQHVFLVQLLTFIKLKLIVYKMIGFCVFNLKCEAKRLAQMGYNNHSRLEFIDYTEATNSRDVLEHVKHNIKKYRIFTFFSSLMEH